MKKLLLILLLMSSNLTFAKFSFDINVKINESQHKTDFEIKEDVDLYCFNFDGYFVNCILVNDQPNRSHIFNVNISRKLPLLQNQLVDIVKATFIIPFDAEKKSMNFCSNDYDADIKIDLDMIEKS